MSDLLVAVQNQEKNPGQSAEAQKNQSNHDSGVIANLGDFDMSASNTCPSRCHRQISRSLMIRRCVNAIVVIPSQNIREEGAFNYNDAFDAHISMSAYDARIH
jgi:hypothetical protein